MIYPKHVALIPDWNRTWAKDKWIPQIIWHKEWFNRLLELSKYIFTNTPIKVFTAWWLSTENLKNRTQEELEYLFELYKLFPTDMYEFLYENKVNFKWIWSEVWLPDHLIDYLRNKEKELTFDTDRYNIMCINYGWRDEIIRWVNKCLNRWLTQVTEPEFSDMLDFAWLPNVDLVIRTKWDVSRRLSWFMLWNIWYAELYFSDLKCPDFSQEQLIKALDWFNSISDKRNFWK